MAVRTGQEKATQPSCDEQDNINNRDMEIKIDKKTESLQETTSVFCGLIKKLENASIKELQGRYYIKVEIYKMEHFDMEDLEDEEKLEFDKYGLNSKKWNK